MKIFNKLGLLVEDLWREQNYQEAAFPDIAARALEETRLGEKVTPSDIIRWVFTQHQLPRQQVLEARFGNPPITLYAESRFYIEIYFWLDWAMDIHQHSFAGAFQVLLGSSILSQFSFEVKHAINANFMLGDVNFKSAEVLKESDIRRIFAGKE